MMRVLWHENDFNNLVILNWMQHNKNNIVFGAFKTKRHNWHTIQQTYDEAHTGVSQFPIPPSPHPPPHVVSLLHTRWCTAQQTLARATTVKLRLSGSRAINCFTTSAVSCWTQDHDRQRNDLSLYIHQNISTLLLGSLLQQQHALSDVATQAQSRKYLSLLREWHLNQKAASYLLHLKSVALVCVVITLAALS